MMAMLDSQQLRQREELLGKFGGNLRGCLNMSFFKSGRVGNYLSFFQHFWFWPTKLRMQMKNDWEVLLMQVSLIQ